VLESETDSGKTEAAQERFARLLKERLVDGMYFAVPTRSAATQLHERVGEAARRVFPENARPPVVHAVPGYIKVDEMEATRLPDFEVLWPDEMPGSRGWAAEHSKRYLAAPIAVGTVDQVLLAGLQARHAHLRGAALLRQFLVVDEIHASDVYMTHLLEQVLGRHLAAGGHAMLMSATLGASARTSLTRGSPVSLPSVEEAAQEPYPLITHTGPDRQEPHHIHAPSDGSEKIVRPELDPGAGDSKSVARRALGAARKGARVLVIRNLVDECIQTQQALETAAGSEVDLLFGPGSRAAPHHSRFGPRDRTRLDEEIEETFGTDSAPGGTVAVATQTVEQSLDIDADLMITDLTPIDVLLQRIGRLHRHDRDRPAGFETARCVVLVPEDRDLTPHISGSGQAYGPHGFGTVYHDLRVLAATWQLLEQEEPCPWQIPSHNRQLVERAAHPDRLGAVVENRGDKWQRHEQWVLGSEQADRVAAGYVELDWSRPFGDELFPDELEAVKTRLGREDYRVELPRALRGPFGQEVKELRISEYQLEAPPDEEKARQVAPIEGGFEFSFGGKRFRYDRFGLVPAGS
jgi:CRISPR-associated endonuclease/helicase Cas3